MSDAPNHTLHLEVAPDDREALTLCLALGALEAMRRGDWPLEAGIWTLGRPAFWRPLVAAGVSPAVVDVLQSADELDALAKLAGRDAADAALDRLIGQVRARLAELPEKSWHASWVNSASINVRSLAGSPGVTGMHFRHIEYGSDDYHRECELREQVLRAPLGLSLYNEDLSAERQQLHFGLFDDQHNLAACAIAVVLSPTAGKIRQMAVSPAHQRQGLGGRIMQGVEAALAQRGCRSVSLHARATATGFYAKLGYAIIGDEFTEVGIPHFHMEKTLGE